MELGRKMAWQILILDPEGLCYSCISFYTKHVIVCICTSTRFLQSNNLSISELESKALRMNAGNISWFGPPSYAIILRGGEAGASTPLRQAMNLKKPPWLTSKQQASTNHCCNFINSIGYSYQWLSGSPVPDLSFVIFLGKLKAERAVRYSSNQLSQTFNQKYSLASLFQITQVRC